MAEEKDRRKMSAIDWVEQRWAEIMEMKGSFNNIDMTYEKAVWVDANLKGGCVIDPILEFHFYDEEDAVAFKLRWV